MDLVLFISVAPAPHSKMIANFVSNLSRAVMAPRAERVAVLAATTATKPKAALRLRSIPAGTYEVFFFFWFEFPPLPLWVACASGASFGLHPHFVHSCILL
jgi:hypothetical protein